MIDTLIIRKNATNQIAFTFKQAGQPFNFAGYTVKCTIRLNATTTDADAIMPFTEITVDDPESGTFIWEISAEDSAEFDVGHYQASFRFENDGVVYIPVFNKTSTFEGYDYFKVEIVNTFLT
jgi:hypothetical protein